MTTVTEHLADLEDAPANRWASWARDELGGAGLGDARLDARAVEILGSFMAAPQASIPRACGGWAKAKATYRFLDNANVDPEILYERHRKSTLGRCAGEKVLLCVSDTTELDYTRHPETEGLGPLSDLVHHGMLLHPTLVVTPERVPLGVVDARTWIRDVDDLGKKKARNREVDEKESRKWLESLEAAERVAQEVAGETRVIAVFDREGDTFDVLATARLEGRKSDVLVRAQTDRRVAEVEKKTWAHVESQPVAGRVVIQVPRKIHEKSRQTELSIRYARITVLPPQDRSRSKGWRPVEVMAVLAREENPPKEKERIEWMLLTTVEVTSADDAFEIVRWYSCRWQIEILFKVLKTGCAAEERQLETAERLKRCLSLDIIVAWRILYLTMIGRDTPELPCTVVFEDYEWKSLYIFVHKSRAAVPKVVPTLREVTRTLGRLGGHLGRKSDGEPGVLTMWRGLQRLPDIAETCLVFDSTLAANE